jgi:hypothetical protein
VSEARRPELEELCRRLVASSNGSLTSVIICTEEAEILAHNPVTEVDQDAAAIRPGTRPPRGDDVKSAIERVFGDVLRQEVRA